MALTTKILKKAPDRPADQGPTETTLYGEKVAAAAGPSDEPGLVLLDDPRLVLMCGSPEYHARTVAGITVWVDWGGRRCVSAADARRMIAAQAEARAARDAEEAAYQAYRDQKEAERRAKWEKETAERRVENERRLARARSEAEARKIQAEADLRARFEAERAARNVPANFDEWRKGKR